MTAPISSISGLITGFQSADLVDAILAQARVPAVRMEAERAAIQTQRHGLATYRGLLDTLRAASLTLRTGAAFDAMSATTTVLSGSGPVASVSATAAATAGSFTVAVEQLARAERLTSATIADPSVALGLTGTFTIDGHAVDVAAGDSLDTIRDRINALATGVPPLAARATILSVSPTDHRLILAGTATGAAGLALADTAGAVLNGLGYLNGGGAKEAAAILTSGADAHFRIDGMLLTRSTNVVTDALAGVTITLLREEPGATTDVSVSRFGDAAKGAMQQFVDAYNAVVRFLQEQGTVTTSRPPLYGEALLRTARTTLPTLLLSEIGGAAADLATVARAGLSLDRDGLLTFQAAVFDDAFANRYGDLRTLFTEQLAASGTDLSLVSTGGHPAGGSWAVEITALATRGELASTGFSGVYDDGGTADTLTVTDLASGRTADVTLTTGMSSADIQAALEQAFVTAGVAIQVELDGQDIRLIAGAFGSQAGIQIDLSGTGDGASELFTTSASALGTDVAGTIGGAAAQGSGQILIGDAGGPAGGITVLYTGTTTGAVGTVDATIGAGARVERLLDGFLRTGDGMLDRKLAQLELRDSRLERQVAALDDRLARRREALLRSFLLMENAIAQLQRQSNALLAFSQRPQER